MTADAANFITPLTLSTLSKNPVLIDISTEENWNNHIELGLWADAFVIAPATANTLAKMAMGICDNLLLATYLSAKCPVFHAPAMDLDMWRHPSTTANIQRLTQYGNLIIPVEHGELASGLVGEGRMAAPENIIAFLESHFQHHQALTNRRVLITAGPTQEAIDPVRYIGNHSSGKMGIALAEAFLALGARVHLILGPTHIQPTPHPALQVTHVQSAGEMFNAAVRNFPETEIAIMAAAVADYRPKTVASEKLKKNEGDMVIELERTQDIAAHLGTLKKQGQLLIGFALETQNELTNAQKKLHTKNFDFIVLNSLKEKGAGFKHDTNKITILDQNNNIENFELKTKKEVAKDIVNYALQYFSPSNS